MLDYRCENCRASMSNSRWLCTGTERTERWIICSDVHYMLWQTIDDGEGYVRAAVITALTSLHSREELWQDFTHRHVSQASPNCSCSDILVWIFYSCQWCKLFWNFVCCVSASLMLEIYSIGPFCLWNRLPAHLQQCDSLGQFKRLLKTHLFGSWYRGTLWHFC